jgi:GAF domain-containing protein
MVRWCFIWFLCLSPCELLAQLSNDAALKAIAGRIGQAVSEEYDCQLVVLWQYWDESAGELLARVLLKGQECEAALAAANSRGQPYHIGFATLPALETAPPSDPTIPSISQPGQPAQDQQPEPPRSLDLIHEVIESTDSC